jgi:transposase
MPKEKSPGRAMSRRYTDVEKERAVRLCRQLAAELGTNHGVVSRIAKQLDYGPESIRKWWLDADVDDGLAGPARSVSATLKRRTKNSARSSVSCGGRTTF